MRIFAHVVGQSGTSVDALKTILNHLFDIALRVWRVEARTYDFALQETALVVIPGGG